MIATRVTKDVSGRTVIVLLVFCSPAARCAAADWEAVGSPGLSAGLATEPSLAVHGGEPYVAYRDNANGWMGTVMTYSGGSWKAVGSPAFTVDEVGYPSLAFHNGDPYVAFAEGTGSTWKATVMRYSGGGWQNVGSAGFFSGRGTGHLVGLKQR
jgi:hypothetical protein